MEKCFVCFPNQLNRNMALRHGNERACDEDTDYASHTVPSCGMPRGPGLYGVVSRRGQHWGTSPSRPHQMSDNIHIPDTPSQSQLDLQMTALLQNCLPDSILPAMAANIPCSSDTTSIMACCKELEKERQELTTLLNHYKIRP